MHPIRKITIVHDERKSVWLCRFSYQRVDGCLATIEIPRDECVPKQLYKALLKQGAALPDFDFCENEILSAAAQNAPIERRLAMNGWHTPTRGFASFRFVVPPASGVRLLPPQSTSVETVNVELQGTLEGWQTIIKGVAGHSTMMLLTLCAVFAAPLLSLLARPNFGLVFFGPSRSGKSSAQLIAASAIGYGLEDHLPVLLATESGLLATAAWFNDHMLPVNEAASARGPKEKVAEAVRSATYGLMGGHDIIRHPSWSGSDGASGRSFKVLPVISSEFSPDEWAERGGQTRDPGETARLIGIPAAPRGASTVFDHMRARSPEWANKAFAYMRQNLPLHRGVAFQEFVKRLARDPDAAAKTAALIVQRFEAQMLQPSMPPIQRDIVAKFGVLAAGGLLACAYHVLPFEQRTIYDAAVRGCRAALASLPDHEAALKRDVALLRREIAQLAKVSATQASDARSPGYVRPNAHGIIAVLRGERMRQLFPETARLRRLLEWCDDEGLLQHDRARSTGRSLGWAEKQPTWPDKTRPHSFVFDLPQGMQHFKRLLGSATSASGKPPRKAQ